MLYMLWYLETNRFPWSVKSTLNPCSRHARRSSSASPIRSSIRLWVIMSAIIFAILLLLLPETDYANGFWP